MTELNAEKTRVNRPVIKKARSDWTYPERNAQQLPHLYVAHSLCDSARLRPMALMADSYVSRVRCSMMHFFSVPTS